MGGRRTVDLVGWAAAKGFKDEEMYWLQCGRSDPSDGGDMSDAYLQAVQQDHDDHGDYEDVAPVDSHQKEAIDGRANCACVCTCACERE